MTFHFLCANLFLLAKFKLQINFYYCVAKKMSRYSVFNQHVVFFVSLVFQGRAAGAIPGAWIESRSLVYPQRSCRPLHLQHQAWEGIDFDQRPVGNWKRKGEKGVKENWENRLVGQGNWVWLRTTEKPGHGRKDGTGWTIGAGNSWDGSNKEWMENLGRYKSTGSQYE